MKDLNDYKKELVNFFELGFYIYPKDRALYRSNKLDPQMEIVAADEVSKNYTKVFYLGHVLSIKQSVIKKLIDVISSLDREGIQKLAKVALSPNQFELKLVPYFPKENILKGNESLNDKYWGDLIGDNFKSIDDRFDGIFKSIEKEFEFVSRIMTEAAELYRNDRSKIKTDDVYFFFNTTGADVEFNLFISPTLIPAISDVGAIEPNREPITFEQLDEYFGYPSKRKEDVTITDELMAVFDRISDRIRNEFKEDRYVKNEACFNYLKDKINAILIPTIVTIRLECYSSFSGGIKVSELLEDENPNAAACAKIIDECVTKTQEHLKSIPIPEGSGIDHYSIEVDSLGIYGRDKDNVVVQAMVDPHFILSNTVMASMSDGLKIIFVEYIKTIKNDSFFSRLGELKAKEEVEDKNKEEVEEVSKEDVQ